MAVALAALAVALTGCSGNNSGVFGLRTVALTTNLRLLQLGDSWTWSYSGTSTTKAGVVTTFSGTREETVMGVSTSGTTNTVTTTSSNTEMVNGTSTTTNATSTVNQNNTTGAITPVSETENGTTTTVTSNSGYATPGTFAAGTTDGGTIGYSTGEVATLSFDVQSQDSSTISALNANWNSWTCLISGNEVLNGATTNVNETQQWVPALGTYLSESATVTDSNGTVIQEQFLLTNTTVPQSAWGTNPSPKRKPA